MEKEVIIAKEAIFERQIVVMKFGGSSVADADRIRHVASIVADYSRVIPVVVVVSAMQGVTDRLYDIFNDFSCGNLARAKEGIDYLAERHREVSQSLIVNHKRFSAFDFVIDGFKSDLWRYTQVESLNASDKDLIVSYGERLSPRLIVEALNCQGISSQAVDAASVIVTDNKYGNARVNLELSRARSRNNLRLLMANSVPIVGGFYGVSEEGRVAILGRGGSDYSAAALANVLNARELILWKEVDGVFSADPKENANAQFYPELTYDQALALSSKGAKILHPEAMKPVAERRITVFVKNTFRPEFAGTRIWGGQNDQI